MKNLLILLMLLSPIAVNAQDSFLEKGFKKLRDNNPAQAYEAWTKNNTLDGTQEYRDQISAFVRYLDPFGNYLSHDYISNKTFSEKNKLVNVIVNFDNGPLYMRILLYKFPNNDWTSPHIKYNIEPEKVWPSELLFD